MAQAGGARRLTPGGAGAADAIVRCFVALQPDEDARGRLDELARRQHRRFPAARCMRRENLHLTLAFIGALPGERARQLAAALGEQTVEAFDWALDAVGLFPGARVLWAGGDSPELDALAARVRRLLDELAIGFDRKPFVAHVTLLRDVPREAAAQGRGAIDPPILWRAGAPLLLRSATDMHGTRYLPVAAGGN